MNHFHIRIVSIDFYYMMGKAGWLILFWTGILVCSFFGVGLQSSSIVGLGQPIFFLLYLHVAHSFESTMARALLWIAGAVSFIIGSVGAFAGIFAEGYVDGASILTVTGFTAPFAAVLMVFGYLAYIRVFRRFVLYGGILVTLVFPTLITSIYFLLMFTPMGDVISPAYSQIDNTSVMMMTSIFGVSSVNFLIHWGAAVIHYFIVQRGDIIPEKIESDIFVRDIRVLYTLVITVGVLWFIGSLLSGLYGGRFYQVPLTVTIKPTIPVTCIMGQTEVPSVMLSRTEAALQQNPRPEIILWAEESVNISTYADELALAANVSLLAKNLSVFIGIAYQQLESKLNKFVLISDTGSVIINYTKVHPVPTMEDVKAGPSILPYADTKYGRIGAAICFDFNYPHFIAQASQKKVDIMLQPSWTWGGMGRYHAMINHVRAVENGFTTLRCSSVGYSGVFAPDYTKISFTPLIANGTLNTVLPITKRNWTWYGVFGETFSWFCVVIGFFYVLLGFLKASWLDRLFEKIPYLNWVKVAGNELHHRQAQAQSRYVFIVGQGEDSASKDSKPTTSSAKRENDSLLSK